MARTSRASTLSSLQIAVGAPILYGTEGPGVGQHFLPDVIEQLNWSFQNRPQTYVSGPCGGAGWAGQGEAAVLTCQFPVTLATYDRALLMRVRLDPDFTSYTVGARCNFPTGESGTVRFTLGGAAPVTIAFPANDAAFHTTTISASSSGTGWQNFLVELRHDSGSLATNELRYIYLADTPVPALPAPQNA